MIGSEFPFQPEKLNSKEGIVVGWPDENISVCVLEHKGYLVPLIKMRDDMDFPLDHLRYGKELPTKTIEVDEEVEKRFTRCRQILKLPMAFAVYAAFNKDIDLETGWNTLPDDGAPIPVLMSFAGEPASEKGGFGPGKSTLTAFISKLTGYPILDFENTYQERAGFYASKIDEVVGKIEDVLVAIKSQSEKKTRVNDKVPPFDKIMNQNLELFKKTKERAEIYLCDMPGTPRAIRDKWGKVTGFARDWNLYDFFSLFSCEGTDFSTKRLSVQSEYAQENRQYDRKVKEVLEYIYSLKRAYRN